MINARQVVAKLGCWTAEVGLTAEAECPPSVGLQIRIACTYDNKLQNRKLY
jgi:hypothetical protein